MLYFLVLAIKFLNDHFRTNNVDFFFQKKVPSNLILKKPYNNIIRNIKHMWT